MTEFVGLSIAGLAQGSLFGLIALGFVLVYKATGVLNFSQGSLVMVGAYFAYSFRSHLGMPYLLAVLVAVLATAAVAVIIERVLLRPMIGRPAFAVIMLTFGLSVTIDTVVSWVWGFDRKALGDPWGTSTVTVGGLPIPWSSVITIVVAASLLTAFFLFFRFSALGVMMRATASDPEAALAQGIPAGTIYGLAWGLAGAVGAVAGILLVSGGRGVDLGLSSSALLVLAALIIGGIDSPAGVVLGGVCVGLIQLYTQGYERFLPAWGGDNPHVVMPYLVLLLVLLIRPYGLLGTREVERL